MGPSRCCIPGRTLAPLLDATGLHIFMTGKNCTREVKILIYVMTGSCTAKRKGVLTNYWVAKIPGEHVPGKKSSLIGCGTVYIMTLLQAKSNVINITSTQTYCIHI